MKKWMLRLPCGHSDVEHLALTLYSEFHKDPECDGWKPYKKYKNDPTVENFRQYAFSIAFDMYEDALDGYGSAFDWSGWETL